MTRPTGPEDPKWGGEGRYGVLLTSAPRWDGDLTALTDDELAERTANLGRHIGNLHTAWDYGWVDGMQVVVWRAATPAELKANELPRWVAARVASCQEEENRGRLRRNGSTS